MIVNVVTPSGTNRFGGTLGLLQRPQQLSARPFDFRYEDFDPRLHGWGVVGRVSGPIVKDRWHFYAGLEREYRYTPQLITVTPADRQALINAGVPASNFDGGKSSDVFPFLIFRTDAEVSMNTRIATRYTRFDNGLKDALVFGQTTINTSERAFNFEGWTQSAAAQAVTTVTQTLVNEFRFQWAKRISTTVANERTGIGASVNIANAANLGPSPNIGSTDVNQSTTQIQNALTIVSDQHTVKFGGGINFIRNSRSLPTFRQYNFDSVAQYVLAASGANRRSYSQYMETFGDPISPANVVFLNLFVQDEWWLTRRLKLSAGLRYDLFVPPDARSDSPLEFSRSFEADRNNFGPRLGLAYLLRDGKFRSVIRVGTGVYFDPPALRTYRLARQNNGDPDFVTLRILPSAPEAPDFPNALGTIPQGSPISRDIDAVSPDFRSMYASHSNLQLEQEIAEDISVTAAFLYSFARKMPVTRNVNCLPTGNSLADGRPVYGTVANPCAVKRFPEYNLIMLAESVGNLNYHGWFVQLNKRYSDGFQFSTSYTYSKARDDAPEAIGPAPLIASDPSNRNTDRGTSWGDVRHVFRMSMVANPKIHGLNRRLSAILNGFQVGLLAFADSGEAFNVVTNVDLNRDGVFGTDGPDRPVGIGRNSFRLPAFFSLDARLSRKFAISEHRSLEVYAEATNVFNGKFAAEFDTLLPPSIVDPVTGVLRGPLPDFNSGRITWRPSRQVQIGLKLNF